MEQRNELLKQLNMTDRQKKGDVQHLLSRSFSRKVMPEAPLSPPASISIPVPPLNTLLQQAGGGASGTTGSPPTLTTGGEDIVSIEELSEEPRVLGSKGNQQEELIDLSSPSQPLDSSVLVTKRATEPAIGSSHPPQGTDAKRSSVPTIPAPYAGSGAPWKTTPPPAAPPSALSPSCEQDIALHLTEPSLVNGSSHSIAPETKRATEPAIGSSHPPQGTDATKRSSLPTSYAGGGAPWKTTPPPAAAVERKSPSGKRERKVSESSSDDSCPEEQSVRTPLLDGEAPSNLPVNVQPSIKHYDTMFTGKEGEDEIPLGGTADSLSHHP